MDKIISKIYEILKDSANLMEAEENLSRLMHRFFADALEKVLSQLNETIKKQKQGEGWKVERNDQRSIQFLFGTVTFTRTLMTDPNGNPHYPLDEWLGIQKYERRSPLVDVKIAELASKCDYRTVADILAGWTDVKISHGAVRNIVNKVGMAQARQDEAMVKELEESAELPQGKKVDVLFAEADGVYIRSTERKKGMEVRHAVLYEGWEKNGNRVSLKGREVIMTTKSSDAFWTEVHALAASRYSLEKAQVVTNSDGGAGYTAEKFREAFAQSENPVIHQLDAYHVYRNLSRVFAPGKSKYKDYVLQAIKTRDRRDFELWMDTYESTLNDPKRMKKAKEFRSYILGNWECIGDWRDRVEEIPEGARGLGAIESNQRHITYRMKKRGMHWSRTGGEAMVKIIQGIMNQTLRKAYLKDRQRSVRKQREARKIVKMSAILHERTRPSVGVRHGSIAVYTCNSSAVGRLRKVIHNGQHY